VTTIRRFFQLGNEERRLLIRCSCVLAVIRVGLWLMSLRRLRAFIARAADWRRGAHRSSRASVERIAWAVRAAARYVPGATCLHEALAAELMLVHNGHPARVRIGMAKTEKRALEGHAWVESDGAVVLGGGDVARYVTVLVLDGNDRDIQ
jgi:Transglutaminase-like superfamily